MISRISMLVVLSVLGACTRPTDSLHGVVEGAVGVDLSPCVEETPLGACRIVWTYAGSVGGRNSPEGLEPIGMIPAIDSRERVYLPSSIRGQLVVWAMDGSVLGTFGSDGDGPGEFRGLPAALISVGDTVHVRDDSGTWSVFSSSWIFVRKHQAGLSFPMYLSVTDEGHMIEGWGDPPLRVLESGGPERSRFGATGPDELFPRRIVASVPEEDRFWAAETHSFTFSEWGLDGTLYRTVSFSFPDFPEPEDDGFWMSAGDGPPPASVTHLAVDSRGLLWVNARVPDSEFKPMPPPSRSTNMIERTDQAYDFLALVIDPDREKIVATALAKRMQEGVTGFLPGGWGFRISQDEFGIQEYHLGKVDLGVIETTAR